MTTLVVGTDFSTRSDRAMRRAILLARQAGYELLLVHVIEQPDRNAEFDEQDYDAEELLAGIGRSVIESDGLQCRTGTRRGRVGDQLAEAALEAKAELILIGPHGKRALRDWISGSTAERIIARAEVPLIVTNAVPAQPYRRYLLPIDFEAAARETVNVALRLPFVRESDIVFVHVYDAEAREMLGRALVSGNEREDYLRRAGEAARSKLTEFVHELGCRQARTVVRELGGSTASDIVRVGHEEDADLVIVAPSNKGMLEEAIVGSVTENLLRTEHDIMIVPQRLLRQK
jgi:universal stress protein E